MMYDPTERVIPVEHRAISRTTPRRCGTPCAGRSVRGHRTRQRLADYYRTEGGMKRLPSRS
jgi:hypothetical protein